MIAEVHLERIDGENIGRYYTCSVKENLFGDIQLDRFWGCIGESEHRLTQVFQSSNIAISALSLVQFVKEKRGYSTVYSQVPQKIAVNLIPRRFHPYLGIKLCCLFKDDPILSRLSLNILPLGIIYAADLVQLTERQVIWLFANRMMRLGNLKETLNRTIYALKSSLAKFGLSLEAAVPGWRTMSLQSRQAIPNL